MSASPPLLQGKVSLNFARASDRVGAAGLSPAKPERGKVWKPIQGIGVKRQYRDKMTARDSRRDCRIGSSLSLRERDLGVRAQSLLNPDAEVKDIPTLTPALSRRERVVYAGRFRLMPMGAGGEVQSPSVGCRLLPTSCKVS